MGAWLKLFTDGSTEYGSDELISQGKASWSKGRLDHIKEVRLFSKNNVISLSIFETSWHQFDKLVVAVMLGPQQAKITHRVIQAEIQKHHIGKFLICSRMGSHFFWAIVDDLKTKDDELFHKKITANHIGEWITVILPEEGLPAIMFSSKGKINHDNYVSR